MCLRDAKAPNYFPAITRARHVGSYSSIHNKDISIPSHLNLSFTPFPIVGKSSTNEFIADQKFTSEIYVNLLNDEGVQYFQAKLFYCDEDDKSHALKTIHKSVKIVYQLVEEDTDVNDNKRLDWYCSKTECEKVFISIKNPDLSEAISSRLKKICNIEVLR